MDHTEPSFDRMVERYRPYLVAFARRRVTDDAVDDIVAETFAVAWRRRDVVPVDALPWLYATARNVVGTRYRAEQRWSMLARRLAPDALLTVADTAEELEAHDDLVAAFAQLSDDDRELLLLVAWDGLGTNEISRILGMSTGTVSVRLHRARTRLRRALDLTLETER